ILRDSTSGRGRTGVIEDPVGQFTLGDVVAYVVGSNDGDAAAFVDGHARAIEAGAITGMRQLVHPSAKIRVIHGRQAAALFDVQEYHGVRWKAFLSCGCRGLARVACSLFPSRRHSILEVVEDVLRRPLLLKFAALRAAVENQETK